MPASQAALEEKLAESFKASALAHELRQPLSQLLLQPVQQGLRGVRRATATAAGGLHPSSRGRHG
jgi:hypothetical protein